jgi:DNA-binding CsgD family transcriptional regulator
VTDNEPGDPARVSRIASARGAGLRSRRARRRWSALTVGTVTSMIEAASALRSRKVRAREPGGEPAGRLGAGLAVLGRDLVVTQANAACTALFGATPVGAEFPRLFLPAVRDTLRRELAELASGAKERFEEQFVGLGPGGEPFLTAVIGQVAIPGPDGGCLVVIVTPAAGREPEPAAGLSLGDLDAQILEGLASGETTVRLAMRLFLSRQGVDYRIGSMLRKLEAPNRAALVSKAYALGVLERESWPPRVAPGVREP